MPTQHLPSHDETTALGAAEYGPTFHQQFDRQPLPPRRYQEFIPLPIFQPPSQTAITHFPLTTTHTTEPPEHSPSDLHTTSHTQNGAASGPPPERNQLDIARIEGGLDTRTTVMVKNIPNKMSDKDLITYIANVAPRKIDFLYLRMDFQNGEISSRSESVEYEITPCIECNVGYAFVNFISVEDLLIFAKSRLGVKW
jgi:hypothetical protein